MTSGSKRIVAVVVAAGRGLRMGGGRPKQWRPLRDRALVAWSLDAFDAAPEVMRTCLVVHSRDAALAEGYRARPHLKLVDGGATRAESVRAGLESLEGGDVTHVLIHDAARPLVSGATIAAVADALDSADGAAPGLAPVDAIWRVDGNRVTSIENRDTLMRAQTPQGFRLEAILAAHRAFDGDAAADDVAVALAAGLDIAVVAGDERNLKITHDGDFALAEAFLGGAMNVRLGHGYDVHAFGAGDGVLLCGVRVPHDRGLAGHSDADVGLHAITDAILGAIADGDIGRHFPPSDTRWRGADSAIFLTGAVARAGARGYRVGQVDCTLICETPKIAPHADAMRARVAEIVGIEVADVSVKATTTEGLGFVGRREGIAAMATATLTRP